MATTSFAFELTSDADPSADRLTKLIDDVEAVLRRGFPDLMIRRLDSYEEGWQ